MCNFLLVCFYVCYNLSLFWWGPEFDVAKEPDLEQFKEPSTSSFSADVRRVEIILDIDKRKFSIL